jgi:hypothetical protein
MHKQPPFDPIRDFIPVALVTEFPLVVVIKPSLPAGTLAEFIALLKAEPDKHTFGSSGVGGSSRIPAEMFTRQAGVSMIHVPFRGNGPSSAALIGGQIDMIIDGLAPQLGNIADGRVRVLGVTTKSRTLFLPDVPAVSETLPGYQFPMWVGLFAPAKTPKPIAERLHAGGVRCVLPRAAQVQRRDHHQRETAAGLTGNADQQGSDTDDALRQPAPPAATVRFAAAAGGRRVHRQRDVAAGVRRCRLARSPGPNAGRHRRRQ